MLLQQLKLENIRSYTNQTITFPSGSTILAGDIGSGKSTILLAIEFALFGTSRPDLPAEALLRKGANNGSVELQFVLDREEIIIKRNLKRDKDGIKQTAGYVLINDLKKELMPIELKAEMIAKLGYPEEFITKNKNYLFRYTVYTPQEEMKLILQDEPEARLDVLRKAFNIDKYKTVRENLQYYLRILRQNQNVLQAKTEPYEEQKQKLERLNLELEQILKLLAELTPQLHSQKEQWQQQKEILETLEQQQQVYWQKVQQQKHLAATITEKKQLQQQLKLKTEQIERQLKELLLPESLNQEEIEQQLKALEEQKNLILTANSRQQERLNYLQKLIQETQQNLRLEEAQLSSQGEKELLIEKLTTEIQAKESWQKKSLELEEYFTELSRQIASHKTLINQSLELKNKIQSLAQCPTCLQEVTMSHKQEILTVEEEKIRTAERLLTEYDHRLNMILVQRTAARNNLQQFSQQENMLIKLKVEQQRAVERQTALTRMKEQLLAWNKEKEEVEINSQQWPIAKVKELDRQVQQSRLLLQQYQQQQYLERNRTELLKQETELTENLQQLQSRLITLEQELETQKDVSIKINEQKITVNHLAQKEQELQLLEMRFQTQKQNLQQQQQELQLSLQRLQELKNSLKQLQELHYWLEEHFLNLTYTIEKQVMLNIHHLFSQLFQEWFSILIEDGNMSSRLDDAFTPVIEQNGYEIDFANLSGGERTSAALAYRLALNKVINEVIPQIKTKDLLILDEPTDGFSSEQLDKVREVLERLNLKQTLIVSHESKIETFVDNVIRVRKEGQVSGVS